MESSNRSPSPPGVERSCLAGETQGLTNASRSASISLGIGANLWPSSALSTRKTTFSKHHGVSDLRGDSGSHPHHGQGPGGSDKLSASPVLTSGGVSTQTACWALGDAATPLVKGADIIMSMNYARPSSRAPPPSEHNRQRRAGNELQEHVHSGSFDLLCIARRQARWETLPYRASVHSARDLRNVEPPRRL
jgi:hypothetical protein